VCVGVCIVCVRVWSNEQAQARHPAGTQHCLPPSVPPSHRTAKVSERASSHHQQMKQATTHHTTPNHTTAPAITPSRRRPRTSIHPCIHSATAHNRLVDPSCRPCCLHWFIPSCTHSVTHCCTSVSPIGGWLCYRQKTQKPHLTHSQTHRQIDRNLSSPSFLAELS